MGSPEDRRQHERYDLQLACQISFDSDEVFSGLTRNISVGGAKIILEKTLPEISKGTPCQLHIQTGSLRDINVNALVMRHRDNSVALFFKILDRSVEEALARYLATQSSSPL
jgi:c-di-GMP-binding flagellar brake protein YcgR